MATVKPTKKDIEDNTLMAALSYLSVLCLVPLLLKKDSPFVQFHAKQGLALFIVEVIAGILSFTIILSPITSLIMFVTFIASVYGIYLALTGKTDEIPGVQPLIEKLNI